MLRPKIVLFLLHSICWTSTITVTLTKELRRQWGLLVNNLTLIVKLKRLKINRPVMRAHKSHAVCTEQRTTKAFSNMYQHVTCAPTKTAHNCSHKIKDCLCCRQLFTKGWIKKEKLSSSKHDFCFLLLSDKKHSWYYVFIGLKDQYCKSIPCVH